MKKIIYIAITYVLIIIGNIIIHLQDNNTLVTILSYFLFFGLSFPYYLIVYLIEFKLPRKNKKSKLLMNILRIAYLLLFLLTNIKIAYEAFLAFNMFPIFNQVGSLIITLLNNGLIRYIQIILLIVMTYCFKVISKK